MKISAVYKITNTITGDFYIGSSKDVKLRWMQHKRQSTWKNNPNKQLYKDIQKFGVDKFEFQVIEEVEIGQLKEMEQQFIEKLQPTYNQMNARGLDIERRKEYQKEYGKEYRKTNKSKEYQKQYQEQYENQLCYFNNEVLTLHALYERFRKAGIIHPTSEAKRYLIGDSDD